MLRLLKFVSGPWEQARKYLREDLDNIETIINERLSRLVGNGSTLTPGAISGDSTPTTRYVANTGPGNTPMWDQVNLSNGVKSRLPLSNFRQATVDSILLGRGDSGAGDFEEITLGSGLTMTGTTLSSSGSSFASSRVILTGEAKVIPNRFDAIFAVYFAIEGTGSLTIEGDGVLAVL